jgi:ABC-type transporter Mla subunit MlaD
VSALQQLAESLQFTHQGLEEAVLRLPRAEDYDPLTEPLQRLAAAVPLLLRALEGREARPAVPTAAASPAGATEVREAVASAREHLEAALERLPRREDYEPAARNLREMASVSPSLMSWLAEVPALSAPLADSVSDLREALLDLDRALVALGPNPAIPRVKITVRG